MENMRWSNTSFCSNFSIFIAHDTGWTSLVMFLLLRPHICKEEVIEFS